MTFSGWFGNATRNSVEVVVIIRKTVMSCLGRGLCLSSSLNSSQYYLLCWEGGDTCLCACN